MVAPEIAEQLFEVIEGGNVLGDPAEIIQFPIDNGSGSVDAVAKTFTGTNGTSFTYYVRAFAAEIGAGVTAAVSAGAAYLGLEVGVLGAAVAPALGITTGYVLYNLTPEFWDSVANELIDAGETVGGKVICLMDKYGNLTFSQNAIEIMKNAFLEAGIFDTHYNVEDQTVLEYPNNYNNVNFQNLPVTFNYMDNPPAIGTQTYTINSGSDIKFTFVQWINSNDVIMITWTLVSENPFNVHFRFQAGQYISEYDAASTPILRNGITYHYLNSSFSTNRYNSQYGDKFQGVDPTLLNSTGNRSAWDIAYYAFNGTKIGGEGLQDGAVYPDMNPFPDLYPGWHPVEFPDIDGQQLPNRYPLEYPDLLPETEPYQDPAQNPDPSVDPDAHADKVVETITNPDNVPNPNPTPTPEPVPDPDPQPAPDPIPVPDPGTPQPNPPEPDPEPTPSTPIPPVPTPSTVSSNRLFTVYNPSISELNGLGAYLWDNSLIETLKKIWQDPIDGIISLIQIYATPSSGGSSNIILGYLDSGVSAPVVSSQFVTIDCGSINLREKNQNATDYTPYTSLNLYLPFIGIVELDVNEFMNGTINVKYTIDVYTGTCLAEVKSTRTKDMPSGAVCYTFSGNCAQQIPLTAGNATGVLSGLLSAAGAGIAVASGGSLGIAAGAVAIGQSVTHEMLHVTHSGNISANAGIMGNKKPYLIINRQQPYTASEYNKYYGFPANKTVYLGNCTGMTRVKSVRLKTSATDSERNEILNLLENGVIF